MFYTKEKKRHLRPSLSVVLTAIVATSAYVSISTENTLLCAISALIFGASTMLANKLGV